MRWRMGMMYTNSLKTSLFVTSLKTFDFSTDWQLTYVRTDILDQLLCCRRRTVRIGRFGWVAGKILFSAAKRAFTSREASSVKKHCFFQLSRYWRRNHASKSWVVAMSFCLSCLGGGKLLLNLKTQVSIKNQVCPEGHPFCTLTHLVKSTELTLQRH